MRRIISLLLSVLMVVSMCTFISFGASAEEITLPAEPTLEKLDDKTGWTALSSASDFASMTATGKYYLTDNVTLTATINLDFAGEFHGNGFTVTVSAPMFKSLAGATVSNLKIVGNITTSSDENTALLSGTASGATVANVITEGSVNSTSTTSGSYATAGFIAVTSGKVVFNNCYNKASVIAKNPDKTYGVSGFVGYAGSEINFENCVNTGKITGVDDAAGFVAFANDYFSLDGCTNTGEVVASSHNAGGFVAYACAGFDISDCENKGNITSTSGHAAGIGLNTMNAGSSVRNVSRCTNSGTIVGAQYVAGLATYIHNSKKVSFIDCNNTGNVTKTGNGGNANGACGICAYTAASETVFKNCTNSGEMKAHMGIASGILGRLAGVKLTIDNCTNTGAITCYTDITITGKNEIDDHTSCFASGMLGYGNKGSGEEYYIINCTNTGKIIGEEYAGGMAAYIKTGSISIIENCVNTGDVIVKGYDTDVSYAGGMVARLNEMSAQSDIIGCYNSGNISCVKANTSQITSDYYAGGITGAWSGALTKGTAAEFEKYYMSYCYNTGNVVASTYAGGLSGFITGSSTSFFAPVIDHCGIAGDISSATGVAGGVTGYCNIYVIEVSDCFFIGTITASSHKNIIGYMGIGPKSQPTDGGIEPNMDIFDNYVLLPDSTYALAETGYKTDDKNDDETLAVPTEYQLTATDITSGKLAYLMQKATGESETIWGQSIGTDNAPVLFDEKVAEISGSYVNAYLAERQIALNKSFKYTVTAKAADDAKVVFSLNGNETTVEGEVSGDRVVFEFNGIAPQFIDSEITTTLYYGTQAIDTKTETIVDYCEAGYVISEGVTADLFEKVFLYGKAARDYVVANGRYTEAELPEIESVIFAEATAGTVPAAGELEITPIADNGAKFDSATVRFDASNSIVLGIKIGSGVDAAKVTVNGVAVKATDEAGIYEFVLADVHASDYSEEMEFVLAVNGEASESLVYGISIYAKRMAVDESASAAMKALAIATYEYGAAADAYSLK